MVKIFQKILALCLITITPLFFMVACTRAPRHIFNYQNQISLASNMPETWPQYQALKKIVANYNRYEQNRLHFMKVVFLSQKDVKTNHLNNKVNKLLLARSQDVPNILLDSDFGQVHQLAAFNRLLNLQSPQLNPARFHPYFIRGLSSLTSKNYQQSGLYATPTLVLANNSLVINKPILKKILTLMRAKGAQVITNQLNPIVQAIMASDSNLSSNAMLLNGKYDGTRVIKNPAQLWIDNNLHATNALKNYQIDDKIFATYQNLHTFLQQAHDSLQLQSPLYVYGSGVMHDFLTLLDSEQASADEQHPLFYERAQQRYDFPFLTHQAARDKLVRAFNKFIRPAQLKHGDYPENYNVVGLRNGQHGIASHFSVSARYSYKSTVFGQYTNNGFAFNDILYLPSPAKWNDATALSSRQLSRWLLMGIKTSTAKNEAVKTFIDYLYNGTLQADLDAFKEKPRKVANFLQWESSYGMPLANNFNYQEQYETIYSKIKRPDHKYEAIYRGLQNIADSIHDQSALRSFDGNQYTSILLALIKRVINVALKNPRQWDGSRFVAELIKHESDYKH